MTDEKNTLFMSEQLRAAIDAPTRSAVEEDPLPGRWSRAGVLPPGQESKLVETAVAARVVKCASIKGGEIRLTFDLLDETPIATFTSMIDRDAVRLNVGRGGLCVCLEGRVKSVRVDSGTPTRLSVLIDPTA
jgi:hypothetical protein